MLNRLCLLLVLIHAMISSFATPPARPNLPCGRSILARAFLESQKRLDRAAARAMDALRAQAATIRRGTYRRVMRFCFDAPNAASDCGAVDLLDYYILDVDKLVEIHLPLVAPEEERIITYTRPGGAATR